MDKVYNDWAGLPGLNFGYLVSFKALDKGILEAIGPSGIALSLPSFVSRLSFVQSGYIYHYAFVILLGCTLILTLFTLQHTLFVWLDLRLGLGLLLAMLGLFSKVII